MNIVHFNTRALLAAAAVAAAVIAGCGGGVGTGGTGSYAQGTISGFGSIFVNDVRYDDSGASVLDGYGNPKTRDDLRLGMTVAVDAGAVADSGSGPAATATRIQYASEIVGPLALVDGAGSRLVVFGQTVTIDSTTVFDDSLSGGLAALGAGQVVEVYASVDPAGGRYRATRVQPAASGAAYSLRGIASQVNTSARSFAIGNAQFSYTASPPAGLAEGAFVRVTLQNAPPASLQWTVQAFGGGLPGPADGQSTKLKGLISSFASVGSFSVNGQPVSTAGASFPNGSAGLGLGVRVEIDGTTRGGVLQASQVSIKTDSEESGHEFELDGVITTLTVAAQTFLLRGVTVSYAGAGIEVDHGTLADLAVGRRVEVKGLLSSDGTRLDATRISFDN